MVRFNTIMIIVIMIMMALLVTFMIRKISHVIDVQRKLR